MKKYLVLFLAALTVGFQSCDNNDDLWDAIDDLKSRVQALETQVGALNGNLEALQQLYGGATISSVTQSSGKYVITLSNGETIELEQGSKAEAVIPVIGIDANGKWQVSYDGGKTFQSLGEKAVAVDGVTPQFRIEETTGYWQVSYDAGKNYTNVLDTSNQPVKAIGAGEVTDKFFDTVEVSDDTLYVKLLDGTELNIPIVADFYCRIVTTTEGTQSFTGGQTRRFEVQIKGVDQTLVTAPEGWTAVLSDIADNAATLIVTAPTVVTRASADSSKDVAILATAGTFACLAKIEVEYSGEAPVAPTISVSNSTTIEPSQTALTFDVVLSANAESWKYICQPTADAAPDAAKLLADGVAGTGTSVTVENLTASTAYTIYVIAVAGELQSTVASVENTTAAIPEPAEVDYYQNYLDGKDLKIGDLTVNKTAYASAQLLKPSELTNAILTAGGLIFVDNSSDTDLSFTVSGTSINMGDLVLVGRYPERKQATIVGPELRCKYNAAYKNLHIAASGSYNLFSSTNATADPELRIEDCTIEALSNVIYDSHATQNFKKVYLANSIVKLMQANKPVYGTKSKLAYTQQLIQLTNNVFYADSPMANYLVNGGDGNTANYATTQLQIVVENNTIYNIYQPNSMIRGYILAGLTVSKNVGYYPSVPAVSYLTAVYDTANFVAEKGIVTYNYLYTEYSAKNTWSAMLDLCNYKPTDNQLGEGLSNPFSSTDVTKGYFPIDTSVVTTGAGASYDTKLWLNAK